MLLFLVIANKDIQQIRFIKQTYVITNKLVTQCKQFFHLMFLIIKDETNNHFCGTTLGCSNKAHDKFIY